MIVTTVGTSIFTNFLNKPGNCLQFYNILINQEYSQWENYAGYNDKSKKEKKQIETTRDDPNFNKWILDKNNESCAEISSIKKINEKYKDEIEIHLIASETILSRLAAEIIKKILEENNIINGKKLAVYFVAEKIDKNGKSVPVDVIKGLQVNDEKFFKDTGLPNLIDRLNYLGINNNKLILNITGGYKGVIPYLTIFGQLFKNVDIMYLYEKSNDIIEIPKLPINFDWVVQEKFFSLCMIKNIKKPEDFAQFGKHEEIDESLSLLYEREPNKLSLTSLGKILINTIHIDEIESRHVLGFLMEYRFVKHFNNYPYEDCSCNRYPVVKTPNRNSVYNECEIDVILCQKDPECQQFIAIEIKSFLSKAKLEKQVLAQINGFNNKTLYPSEYHVIIYSFIRINDNDLIVWFNSKIAPHFNTMQNCKPRLGYLYVDWIMDNKDKHGNTQNPYKGYLSSDQELDVQYLI